MSARRPQFLTPHEYNVLIRVVDDANQWRGSMIGNPDTTELDAHDAMIREAREALRKISPYRRKP